MSENEIPEVVELSKPSKLKRIKSNAITVGTIVVPIAVFGGLMYISVKMTTTQLETAKLNLETAKLNKS
jgi:methionine synthase I (cobalamin-dependent)